VERRAGHPAMLTIAPCFGNGPRGSVVVQFEFSIYSFRDLQVQTPGWRPQIAHIWCPSFLYNDSFGGGVRRSQERAASERRNDP